MDKITIGCRIIAFLILFSFMVYGFRHPYMDAEMLIEAWHGELGRGFYLIVLMPLYLFINMLAIYGMFTIRNWGFAVAYIAIIFSTIFFSVSYVQFLATFINDLFGIEPRYLTFMVINILVLSYIAWLHHEYQKRG